MCSAHKPHSKHGVRGLASTNRVKKIFFLGEDLGVKEIWSNFYTHAPHDKSILLVHFKWVAMQATYTT